MSLSCISEDYINYIKVGTKWTVEHTYPGPPPPDWNSNSNKWTTVYEAEKDTLVDGKSGIVISVGGWKTKVLSCEQQKVFVLNENHPDLPRWRMLYDFNMEPGDSTEVDYYEFDDVRDLILCKERGILPGNPDIPYLKIYDFGPTEFYPDYTDFDRWVMWLPGIGSTYGLFQNIPGYFSGGIGAELIEVSHNGTTVFRRSDLSSAETIPEEKSQDGIFDLHGVRIEYPRKGGMYIVGGKKIIYK